MESLKKIINLNQAAKISGYTQDYLGYLIRQGDIKGKKVGRSWVTTEEEVQNYLFKQKIRQDKFAVGSFLSRRRTRNIFLATLIIFVGVFSVTFYLKNKNIVEKGVVNPELSSEVEVMETRN
ncbi:MAG: hypothetical protein AAB477_01405 [Patescibacteria group bacterium]